MEFLYIGSKIAFVVLLLAASILMIILASQAKILQKSLKQIQESVFTHRANLSLSKLVLPTTLVLFVLDQVIQCGVERAPVSKVNSWLSTMSNVAGFASQVKDLKTKYKEE